MSSAGSFLGLFARALTLVGTALLGSANLHAEKLVTVRSVADVKYAQRRAETDPPPVETYVFAKGTFFGGNVHDNTLERMPFMRIAETLAYDLRRRNYQPTRDLKNADLVIVVHWGVTFANENNAVLASLDANILSDAIAAIGEARALEAEDSLAGETARMLGSAAAAEINYQRTASEFAGLFERDGDRGASNAELLGLVAALNRADAESTPLAESEMARTLREMINEERYFIIMVAYDGPSLRDGKKKRLWTSRMSIRSAGVNFTIALDRMSNAAARFHGTRQEQLAMEYQKDRRGTVTIGELKVLNDAAQNPAPKKP